MRYDQLCVTPWAPDYPFPFNIFEHFLQEILVFRRKSYWNSGFLNKNIIYFECLKTWNRANKLIQVWAPQVQLSNPTALPGCDRHGCAASVVFQRQGSKPALYLQLSFQFIFKYVYLFYISSVYDRAMKRNTVILRTIFENRMRNLFSKLISFRFFSKKSTKTTETKLKLSYL